MNLAPLLTLAFATFALGFGELMIAGILPAIAADTHVSIALAGQLVTIYALVFAVLSPPLAFVMRAARAKHALIASLIVVAIANAFAAAPVPFAALIGARIVAALGSAVATPLALVAVDAVTDDAFRGRAHGIVFTGFSLAAMLGVPLGTVIAVRSGWHGTFGCVAVLSAAAAALMLRLPDATVAAPPRRSAVVAIFARPALRATLIASALFLTSVYTLFTYFRPYFERRADLPIAMLFFIYGAFGIVGTLVGGIAADRFGARRALLATLAASALVYAALPWLAQTAAGTAVGIVSWALTSWGFSPAVNRQLTAIAGDAANLMMALNLTAFNAGIALGSALGGVTIALGGVDRLPLTAAALAALAWYAAYARNARHARARRSPR